MTAVLLPPAGHDDGDDFPAGQYPPDTQYARAGGEPSTNDLPAGHPVDDAQVQVAGGDTSTLGQTGVDTHHAHAEGIPATPTSSTSTPISRTSGSLDVLSIYAESLDGMEDLRKKTGQRAGALVRTLTDAGVPEELIEDIPEIIKLRSMEKALAAVEHECTLDLQRALRKTPLGAWVKRTVGIGEKQGARLLAAIGDPYWNSLHNRPRTVSELWAYCGYHVLPAGHHRFEAQKEHAGGEPSATTDHAPTDAHARRAGVAAKRTKGRKSNWNNTARMRCYLVSTSCIKQMHSPYRAVYDAGRAHYADATHPDGTPLTDMHKHNRALRLVSKAILKDLWLEAKAIHEGTET